MKKYLSVSAVILLSLSLLSGCGGNSATSTDNTSNNETTEASTTQNNDTEESVKTEESKDIDKPNDVGLLSESKQLSDGSTAYLDGNTLKIVSDEDGEEFTVFYVFEDNKLTMYAEIECGDKDTANAISSMFSAQADQNNVYDVHTEGTKVIMKYNEQYIDAFSSYATAQQIYDAME